MKRHQVRIVGGEYRRTPIPVAEGAHLRPTPDRLRETLFNWLSHFWGGDFSDKRVLDLFAGTGALGFEAASRGVAHACLVEQAAPAIAALRALKSRLCAGQIHIHAGDAMAFLQAQPTADYDLLLLDPPFREGWLERVWPLLGRVLRPGGLVYVESERAMHELPRGLIPLRETRAGQVTIRLLQFAASQKTMNNPEIGLDSLPSLPGPDDGPPLSHQPSETA